MSKRKAAEKAQKVFEDESSSDDSDEDMADIDVEFEFFDPNPDIDFQGLKTLLRQLFDVDSQQFDLGSLADLVLKQNLLGSTIKTDGMESDPWAFLTILNLKEHRGQPSVQELIRYIINQAKKNPILESIPALLDDRQDTQVGLLLTERALNVPPELVPPMYKMLAEEIQWAIDDKEPFQFTHYLIISKCYTEIDSTLDRESSQVRKKQKKGPQNTAETFYFHPEDEIIQKHAAVYGSYNFDNEESEGQSDARRAFQEAGIKPQGSLMLLEAGAYQGLAEALERFVQP